ncbi:MAG: tetratricopeptide repeat protein [Planctomycetota bacterium]
MKKFLLVYLAIIILIPFLAGAETGNIFFLDRQNNEPQAMIKELEGSADRTVVSSTALGWLYLLYENNALKSRSYFEEALAKSPEDSDALYGASRAYSWLGEDELFNRNLMARIKANPDMPELELLLDSLIYRGRSGISFLNAKEKLEFIQSLLSKPLANKFNETLLRRIMLDLTEQAKGISPETFNTWKSLGYPDKWLAIGYFEPYNSNCLDEVYPPEKEISLTAKYQVQEWEVAWHKRLATISNYDNFISKITEPLENRGNCTYLLTWISSPEERTVSFQMNAGNSYKIWLNDAVIACSDRLRNYEPNFQAHGGILRKGYNKLLIKFVGDIDRIQITDPYGAAYPDIEFSIEPPTETVTAAVQNGPKVPRGNRDYFKELDKAPANRTIKDYLLQASFYSDDGQEQEAFGVWEELFNQHKSNAMINVIMGDALRNNNFLPNEKRQDQALKCYKDAEKTAPDCVLARLSLADYYADKDKDKAIEYLKKAISTNPRSIKAQMQLIDMFDQNNWPAESFEVMKSLEKLLPQNVSILIKAGNYYYQQNNYDKALSYYKKAYDLNGDKYRYGEMNISYQRGDCQPYLDTYADMLKTQPDAAYLFGYSISIYRLLKDYQAAEPLYQKLIDASEKDSDKYRLYSEMADFYYEWGQAAASPALMRDKMDKAREYWDNLNKLPAKYSHYNDGLRRYFEFKDGKAETWPDQTDIDVPELVKNAPSEKDYPEAGSIILLEEHLVKIIGDDNQNLRTKETRSHEVVKLLNKSAGERYGDLYKYGDLQIARVYTKDGRVLEPDPIQEGSHSLRLPDLDAGSVIELSYIKREPFSYRGPDTVVPIDDSPLFRRNKEPVMRLRYVVSIPKSVTFKMPHRYLNCEPKKTENGNDIIYTWDITKSLDYDDEVYMPPPKEVIPWVDIYAGTFSTESQLAGFNSRYLKQLVPYNVKAKAAELTGDTENESQLSKIRSLYKFVVAELKSTGGSGGPDSDQSLSQALTEKKGSPDALMMAFLKALDIEAYWALPEYKFRPGSNPDKEGLMINASRAVIYIPAAAISAPQPLFLCPAQFQAFGVLPADIQNNKAYVIMPEGIRVVELPSLPFDELCRVTFEFNIAPSLEGSAKVTGTIKINGETGAQIRTMFKESFNEQQKQKFVESVLGSLFKGFKLNTYDFTDFNIDERSACLNFDTDVATFARKTQLGWEFQNVIRPLELSKIFLRETDRKFPLRLYNIANHVCTLDRMRISLPENASTETPKSLLISTRYGCYSRLVSQAGADIVIERKFNMEEQDIPPDHYQAFSEFCKKIDQAEMETVKINIEKK